MSGNPYDVVGSPNYAAPKLDWANFFPQKQQQQQQQQPGQQQQAPQQGFLSRLQAFLTPALPTGSAVPGAAGPTSVGGAPLMQASAAPMMNSQGLGLY